jgi:hypothetical protein
MSNFVTVNEAISTGLIPKDYVPYFDKVRTCIYCNSDIEISDTRKEMQCSNPTCINTVAHCAAEMMHSLGIRGLGADACYMAIKSSSLWHSSRIASIMTVIETPPLMYSTIVGESRKKSFGYVELISMMHIPELGDATVTKLFSGISNWDALVSAFHESGSVDKFVYDRVGGTGTLAYTISKYVKAYLFDLSKVCRLFEINTSCVNQDYEEVYIGITGDITIVTNSGHRLSKQEYIHLLNSVGNRASLQFILTKSKRLMSYMVADTESHSAQWESGKSMGLLITSRELLAKIINLKANLESTGGSAVE